MAPATANSSSYQHAYQKVTIQEEDGSHVKELDASRGLFSRKRLVLAGVSAVVLSVGWFFASARLHHASNRSGFLPSSCSSWSVIVDDRGIIEDGPGSDGVCDDPVHWYHDQLIDHFGNDRSGNNTWSQKYFINDDYFRGPGYPIFMIMGGEDEANCLFYPFITHTLARIFGGMTLEAEHRFYGNSQPIEKLQHVRDMIGLLTPEQAMADFLRLLKVKQSAYGCSTDRKSPNYCPVITVGASYPGFLAAMMRLVHGDVVDLAYASSAPLPLYAQTVEPNAYFDKVTEAANTASAGCPMAVKATLLELERDILESNQDFRQLAANMGICSDGSAMPEYITTPAMFWHELETAVAANFADFNMANYPPSPDSDLNRACNVFQDTRLDVYEKMQRFWHVLATSAYAETSESESNCFDFHSQIPDGPRGTVTSADWTGGGDGKSGLSWDFQTCTDLVVQAGFGRRSMFPYRPWTLEALTEHCQSRFGVDPTPTRLLDQWHFDDLVGQNASRILFTNGLNDGWSADSILESLGPDLIAINMPNGAHHSDLNHKGPHSGDTDDVRNSYPLILHAITRWMAEVKADMHQGDEPCP